MANWLRHPSRASARNFCAVLIENSGDEQLGLVIPRWLLKRLRWKGAPAGAQQAIEKALTPLLGGDAHSIPGLLEALRPTLVEQHFQWLTKEIWRGSAANVVYESLRCPAVHRLGGDHGISFSETTWQGKVLDRIDLQRLLAALGSVAAHAKEFSLETNDWFGIE